MSMTTLSRWTATIVPFDDFPFFTEVTRLDDRFEKGREGVVSSGLLVMGA